jgi:selenocysteine-specific elongation factor
VRAVIIGTAGHVDHGKTALVRALSGVDTDRLKEEKARGISIDLGFAYMPAPDGSVLGFVDVPGHEKFIHNMLAGAGGIDFALLVVAADDGIMPQTREHLAIIDLLGVKRGIVALSKIDLVSVERREALMAEIASALGSTTLAGLNVLSISTVSGEGIDALRARLFAEARTETTRPTSGRFRLAVDRSFSLTGIGTVVTGTVLSGAVAVGDHVKVSPSGISARVRSIHAQNRPAERSAAGERCALNLAGDRIDRHAVHRGDVVLDADLHAPTERIDATLRTLPTETKAVVHWLPVRLHHAAAEVGARVVLLSDQPVAPGTEARVQLVLDRPIAATAGDRFVLRDTSAQRTIGGGRFIDLRAPARKRRTPERVKQLDALAIANPKEALIALCERAPFYVDLTAFARDRAFAAEDVERLAVELELVRLALQNAYAAVSQATWAELKSGVTGKLAVFHADYPDLAGVGVERLRLQLQPRLSARLFAAALQKLAADKDVALDGAWVRLPSHEIRLTAAEEVLWQEVKYLIAGDERFRPPRIRDIARLTGIDETKARHLFKLASRIGKVDEVAHDHFFLRSTVAEMADTAADLAAQSPNGQFGAAEFRDQLDNGRKVAIQILEFFDRHGVTLRRGDLRRINKQRRHLFRRPDDEPSAASEYGRESSLVGRPDFKSGKGRTPVFGGFDSRSLPPLSRSKR